MTDSELPPLSELTYGKATSHVSTRVPVASPSSPVEEIRRALEENRYDSLTHVAVLEDAKLAGVLKIEDLFSAPTGSSIGELMDPEPPFVTSSTDQETAARQAVRNEASALAVVDEGGRFVGFIPPHRLLSVLLWEHEEDMYRLGGLLRDTSEARDQGSPPWIDPVDETGNLREYTFEASPLDLDLGGRKISTWGYNGSVPGPEIRVTEGDTLRVTVQNRLPADTTVHWHGLPVPNAMDGVPRLTQPPITAGEDFAHEFVVPTAGTYIYHSHAGLQLDKGLYGPLVVEPNAETLSYDREYSLLFDDWLDGVSGTPEDTLEGLQSSGGMGGGMMRGGGGMMGSSTVEYPLYLINGRTADDPETMSVRRGEKVRLRLMNPAAETIFHFAVAGHSLTVTHADGLPVEPVEVETLRIGMGERYDVLLEADNSGVWQAAAIPEGKSGVARTLLRYEESAESSPPPADFNPRELEGRLLSYEDLRNARGDYFSSGAPDRTHELTLSGGMGSYVWTIDGQSYPEADPLEVREGERVSVILRNRSTMPHPMHLHEHFFQVRNGTGWGPLKDTVLVEPHMGEATLDFVADNPDE